jgi:hypothetical protein
VIQLVREGWSRESLQDLFGNPVPIEAGECEGALDFLDGRDTADEAAIASYACRENLMDLLIDEFCQGVIALEIEVHVLVEEVITWDAVDADRFEFAFRIDEVDALRCSAACDFSNDFVDAVVRSEPEGIEIARQLESPLRFAMITDCGVTAPE